MKVFGLIGEKLSHSLSPAIHKEIYKHLSIDAAYSLFQVQADRLEAAIQGIKALDINGVNVTIPYKIKIMEQLDFISPEALKIGAVNTINNLSGCLDGYNTDYMGFARMLDRHDIHVKGQTAVILGSGGVAKAVTAYLEDSGITDLCIIAREPEKTISFDKTKYKILSYSQLKNMPRASLLVNCTPVGMFPHTSVSPIDYEGTSKFDSVVDLIYNPHETLLIRQAKCSGIPAYNGLYMLVAQAAAAVEIWEQRSITNDILEDIYCSLHIEITKGK